MVPNGDAESRIGEERAVVRKGSGEAPSLHRTSANMLEMLTGAAVTANKGK